MLLIVIITSTGSFNFVCSSLIHKPTKHERILAAALDTMPLLRLLVLRYDYCATIWKLIISLLIMMRSSRWYETMYVLPLPLQQLLLLLLWERRGKVRATFGWLFLCIVWFPKLKLLVWNVLWVYTKILQSEKVVSSFNIFLSFWLLVCLDTEKFHHVIALVWLHSSCDELMQVAAFRLKLLNAFNGNILMNLLFWRQCNLYIGPVVSQTLASVYNVMLFLSLYGRIRSWS